MVGTKCIAHPHQPYGGRFSAGVWKLGIGAVIVVAAGRGAIAGDCDRKSKYARPCSGASLLYCGDDYCRKPLPCVPCPVPGCRCDDYCRKPLPCVPCPAVGCCCDDYCRKPMPCLCWPPPAVKYCCGLAADRP
jgi:hypothetical protein